MQTKKELINIKNLSYYYEPDEPALLDLNMTIKEGEFICVLGPSGCGKSTLMSILSGLAPPSSGDITVLGKNLYENEKAINLPHMGYVFQDHRLLAWRTVRENITLVMKAAKIPESEWDKKLKSILNMLQISQFENTFPLNLSGGQRQRVSIARALAVDPSFILMDEPFSTLDEVTARFMRREIVEIWRKSGKTIFFVTHSIREAIYLADKIFIMTKGPGKIYKNLSINLPRPRDFEDLRLAEIEAEIIDEILSVWGYEVEESNNKISNSAIAK